MNKYVKMIMTMLIFIMANTAFAYDKNDSFEVATEKLLKTDCSVNFNDCRYYAAIEYVSFVKACQIAFEYKFKTITTEKDIIFLNDLIVNWKAIEEPTMHNSVLSSNNPFKEKLTKDLIEYLKNSPADDISIECERINLIKENKNPEEMSDLISRTLNFKQWYTPIMKKNNMGYLNSDGKLILPE